jgi:hypothetical protein
MSRPEVKADAAFHTFDPDIAIQVGVNAAVVYRNLVFWVRHNETNRRNFHEGRFWTYNSLSAFNEQFPYLTAKQIRTALDKLVEAGLILKGNFAQDKFKRANWYALGEPICPEGRMERPERADDAFAPEGSTSAPEGKCYRNISEPYSKPYPSSTEAADADLEIVWAAYPEDRRRDRKACRQLVKDILRQVSRDELVVATQAYSAESADFTRSKVAFIDNWLRDRKWQRHLDDLRLARKEAEAAAVKRAEQIAGWIRARHRMCQHLTKTQVHDVVGRNLITLDEAHAAGCL